MAVSRWPKRTRTLRGGMKEEVGIPKFNTGDRVGQWTITMYLGHSYVNKRTAQPMSKTQHWYQCRCTCGTLTSRSQQELIDPRSKQCCNDCKTHTLS